MRQQLWVSEAAFYVWKEKFAHLGVSELCRTRWLEQGNRRHKQVVADLTRDEHMLAETLRNKPNADTTTRDRPMVRDHVRD